MNGVLPYDKTSKDSILAYARRLLGKNLRSLYPDAVVNDVGRGGLGQAVERFHFRYVPNSDAQPDFAEAGLELKCSPLKELGDGSTVAKERLVLNIINYIDEAAKDFKTSSFWKKNEAILLMFYLHQAKVSREDLYFKLIRNWSIPPEDMKIFEDDWTTIHEKIISGHAHEIHEGDTFYLAACEKGSTSGAQMREQPGTAVKAQQRAYSIKKCYMDQIVLESLVHPEMICGLKISNAKKNEILKKRKEQGRIVRRADEYRVNESFVDLVRRRFEPYFGLTVEQIALQCGVMIGSPKSMSFTICRGILGVREKRIEEFEKAGVQLKTIRLGHDGSLKEAMSFSTIKFCEIVNEESWETSEWYEILTHKFFFVVFRKSEDDNDLKARLEDVFFWSMPMSDLNRAQVFWRDTRDRVRNGDYGHFIKSTEHEICHIRPKAQDARDLMLTPQGTYEKKKCYWLNRRYVLDVVNENLRKDRRNVPQVFRDVAESLRYSEYLPLYSLRAACGKFGGGREVETLGWVRADGVGAIDRTMYVVQAEGHSMEPLIHDGDLCIMRQVGGGSYENKTMLIQYRDVDAPEDGGSYSIKKYTHEGNRVVLIPRNRQFSNIEIEEDGDRSSHSLVGEFWKVLSPYE